MQRENLRLDVSDGIATITIDRPAAMNSMTAAMLADLEEAVSEVVASPACRAAIITGAGPKAFVAGGDIALLRQLEPGQAHELAKTAQRIFAAIEQAPKVFIAAVNGYALGGGCELALACDLRIAAENARFGQPEVNIGTLPGFGGTQRLPRLVGKGRALEMILSGEMVDAQEALRIGLVNRVVPAAELLPSARRLAGVIAAKSLATVKLCKEAVNRGLEMALTPACAYEAELFAASFATADCKEGMSAFLEKRPPIFRDC